MAETNQDQVVIIEEKISKVNGDYAVKKYLRGKLLGKGGFAKCYEVTNLETKKVLAAKIIVKSSLTKNRARQKLISEIKIHKSLHHTNIVNFEHVFEDSEHVYILLEVCTNQTLNELLKRRKRLTDIEVQCYVAQIVSSLKYLHSNRVIHRDLKLGNLFLSDKMEIKLGDFGLASKLEFEGERKRTICGTPNYIAPEILEGKSGHSYEVDIWSLVGKPPFETPDVKTTYKKIKQNSYQFPETVQLSDSAKSLITKILVLEPTKRPSLDEITSHPFMNNGGTIPKLLPLSTLACPPSASYMRQFLPQANSLSRVPSQNDKFNSTVPQNNNNALKNSTSTTTNQEKNYNNTDKFNIPAANTQNNFTGGIKTDSQRPNTVAQNGKTFQSTLGFGKNTQAQEPKKSQSKSEIHVKKWVDYSSKYGLGYLLSNGSTGVFFNDSTKIILDPKANYFEYIERKGPEKQDIVVSHKLNEYPKELQKKVTLLQHFRNYLENDSKELQQDQDEEEDSQSRTEPLVYVKKWMKTRHAIMFRLSNKIVQVDFKDKTEIILSSENKMVTYVNKKGERSNYPLATALESTNVEMAKRLKYTKEILQHMLNANQQQQVGDDKNLDFEKGIQTGGGPGFNPITDKIQF